MNNIENVGAFYDEWLQNPVTKEVKSLLHNHEETIINTIARASFDCEERQLRSLAAQIQTLRAVNKLLFDKGTFIEKATPKKIIVPTK